MSDEDDNTNTILIGAAIALLFIFMGANAMRNEKKDSAKSTFFGKPRSRSDFVEAAAPDNPGPRFPPKYIAYVALAGVAYARYRNLLKTNFYTISAILTESHRLYSLYGPRISFGFLRDFIYRLNPGTTDFLNRIEAFKSALQKNITNTEFYKLADEVERDITSIADSKIEFYKKRISEIKTQLEQVKNNSLEVEKLNLKLADFKSKLRRIRKIRDDTLKWLKNEKKASQILKNESTDKPKIFNLSRSNRRGTFVLKTFEKDQEEVFVPLEQQQEFIIDVNNINNRVSELTESILKEEEVINVPEEVKKVLYENISINFILEDRKKMLEKRAELQKLMNLSNLKTRYLDMIREYKKHVKESETDEKLNTFAENIKNLNEDSSEEQIQKIIDDNFEIILEVILDFERTQEDAVTGFSKIKLTEDLQNLADIFLKMQNKDKFNNDNYNEYVQLLDKFQKLKNEFPEEFPEKFDVYITQLQELSSTHQTINLLIREYLELLEKKIGEKFERSEAAEEIYGSIANMDLNQIVDFLKQRISSAEDKNKPVEIIEVKEETPRQRDDN